MIKLEDANGTWFYVNPGMVILVERGPGDATKLVLLGDIVRYVAGTVEQVVGVFNRLGFEE